MTMTDNPLAKLGELTKPATVLVEKISDAVGGIFKPCQIVRVAKAEAEADRIRAESEIQVTDLHRRAMQRFFEEEAKNQSNMEEITRKALPHLKVDASPEDVENDWIRNFFDKCRLVSDDEMQELWGKVLAGQANAPGGYSRRTVNLLQSLDKEDAIQFTQLCGCGWMVGGVTLFVYDVTKRIYADMEITFGSLAHLDAIGLIRFESLAGFQRKDLPERFMVHYFGTPVILDLKEDMDNSISVGQVLLTQAGEELAPIAGAKANESFFGYVLQQWIKMGINIASPVQRPT